MFTRAYGVTSATVLVTFGIAPAVASASIHTSEMVVDSVSALSHHKLRNVEFRWLKPLLFCGVLGAALGAWFLVYVAGLGFAKSYIRVVLLCMSAIILCKHTLGWKKLNYEKRHWKSKHLAALCFLAGSLMFQVGWMEAYNDAPFILTGSNPQ